MLFAHLLTNQARVRKAASQRDPLTSSHFERMTILFEVTFLRGQYFLRNLGPPWSRKIRVYKKKPARLELLTHRLRWACFERLRTPIFSALWQSLRVYELRARTIGLLCCRTRRTPHDQRLQTSSIRNDQGQSCEFRDCGYNLALGLSNWPCRNGGVERNMSTRPDDSREAIV